MRVNKIIYCAFFMVFLGLNGCKQKEETSKVETPIFDQTTNWALLNKADAVKNGNSYAWDVEFEHPVDYVVQVVFDALPINETIATVTINAQELGGKIQQNYTTYDHKIVSEFQKTIKISDITKKHVLTIETEANFNQIRIIPSYKNPIGSGVHHKEWLKMHTSPEKQAALKWFKQAKFGMFIHWGLYSEIGGVWKGTKINNSPFPGPKVAEWLMHAFQISRAEYAALAETFNPDKSFAKNIAKLAKDAGMKYVVITSKHHDGFALFDSKCSEYDMVDATPYKADIVKELYEACLEEGLDFGVYYSHGNDWMDGTDGNYANVKKVNDSLGIYTHSSGKNRWDPSPNTHVSYIKKKAMPQVEELIQLLPKLKLIWFDGEGFVTEEQSFDFYKKVYELNPNILVNRRVGWNFGDYEDAGDNKIPSADDVIEKYWETCGTTNNSWGYKSYDYDWKTTKETLYYIIDIASKGGNYLLNIGPDGKGNVPLESQNILREVGQWMHTNGEAIYGTTRWKTANEGQKETLLNGTGHRAEKSFQKEFTPNDFWFTTKENNIYAISLVKPRETTIIHAFNKNNVAIKNVSVLGYKKPISWTQTEKGLEVDTSGITTDENGFVVVINLTN
ncbi:alpha-L-fucosidase [Wenyingzhuangia sp. 2_MG-2023]|uniref:alpha-L-fucosidase n=1 Tax=Wenyingzhuangia sp. 2_MG-2023 TaxID=3062639 RepID=UPI0026E433B3|nr:alpha-L-fucosidase [Wenyingzhuangia sp. 2_MG-2023]MDO6736308.1 alpha-L-fucosidase [Wenyingzhuangia sp. 2_MG-2023]